MHLCDFVTAGLRLLLSAGHAALNCFKILDEKFVIDDLLVADRIDCTVNMGDVIVIETTQHMYDRIRLPYVGKKLVAETFALAGAFYEAGDIDNFYRSGNHTLRLTHIDERVQAVIGDCDDTDIGFDCTEREIGRLSLSV